MLSQEKAQKAKEEMLSWGKELEPTLQTEISDEALADALLTAAEEAKKKEFDLEAIIFFHMVASLYRKESHFPHVKTKIEDLYFSISSPASLKMMEQAKRDYRTDEVPTEFMRAVYKDYKRWREEGKKMKNPIRQRISAQVPTIANFLETDNT